MWPRAENHPPIEEEGVQRFQLDAHLIVKRQHVHFMSFVGRQRRERSCWRLRALTVYAAPLRLPHAPAERVHHHFSRATAAVVHLQQTKHTFYN